MGFFDAINLIFFTFPDVQFAVFPWLAAAIAAAAGLGAGTSIYAGSQAKKAQEAARSDLQRGREQAEQIVSRLAQDIPQIRGMENQLIAQFQKQLAQPGFTPEELETARFGQRRALEDAMPGARQQLLQGLSQRGLLRSGIGSRGFQGLEQERFRGIAGIEQALQLQNIMQRRQDISGAQQGLGGFLDRATQIRLQQAGILAGGGEGLANISLQGGLAQAAGTQSLANALLGLGGSLGGGMLGQQLYGGQAPSPTLPAVSRGPSFGSTRGMGGFGPYNFG